MDKKYITKTFQIKGMTCTNCENKIERRLKNTSGIANAIVSYAKGMASVTYDPELIGSREIQDTIEQIGYSVSNKTAVETVGWNGIRFVGMLIILIALYVIVNRFGGFQIFNYFPQAQQGAGYGMLFVIGILTSTHCIAMCGGINLSQCVPNSVSQGADEKKFSAMIPSLQYNSGRVLSYTIIGGIVGAVGSIVSFSGAGKGIVAVVAGVFMVIMGLNMLNLFPSLRKFNPRMPKVFAEKINEQKKGRRPFYIGLLNGLMPCGPLQAMQLYALSTGDPFQGALSMMIFSLGTVPLMFGLGALSTILTKKFTSRMMTFSAALVVILGVFMFSNGMALSGYALPFASGSGNPVSVENEGASAQLVDGIQIVTTELTANGYEPIIVQAGIPVQWNMKAKAEDITGCNERIIIPQYNIEKQLVPGDNIIEFTPAESGIIPFSCWMGMIRSQIAVVDDLGDTSQIPVLDNSKNRGMSCCGN